MISRTQVHRTFDKLATPVCYIAPSIMILADYLTIILNPGLNPLQESISRFAVGPWGWLEKAGMILIAGAFIFIGISLLKVKQRPDVKLMRLSGALLCFVAIGFLMIATFNTNVIGTILSFHGFVHEISSGAVSIVFYLACLILMWMMLKREGLKLFGLYSGITFLVGLTVLVLISANFHDNSYLGLMERLIAGFNLLWIILIGPQVIKMAKTLQ